MMSKEKTMAVGPHPNLYGNVSVGAPCASCGGESSMGNAQKYQEYGGQFVPAGLPQPSCNQGNCSQGTSYSPATGGARG